MYILVNCKHARTNQKCTKGYKDFNELKEEVINILDARGWDNKEAVDLRKVQSCLEYVLEGNYNSIEYKLTNSLNKYIKYKEGTLALVQ